MPYKGAILLLIWTILLHSVFHYDNITLFASLLMTKNNIMIAFIIISIATVVTYLLYPAAGLLAELYCSRYKVMIVGNIIAVVGGIIVVPATILLATTWSGRLGAISNSDETIIITATIIGIILHQFGLGLFEANAIQFGVDQLLFASNDDVSKFVKWYYWTTIFLQLIPAYYCRGFIIFIIASLFCSCCKHHYMIEPVRYVNPVRHIVKVLQYARCHTAPVLRSAFTYGEGPPSRLDLAKDRYGGPYTTEEVEDVKSFGRILLLLLSQFGILLAGGISLFYVNFYKLMNFTGWIIPSGLAGFGIIVPLIIIPIYMILIRPYFQRYIPNMIKRMGISLMLVIVSLSLFIPIDYKLCLTSPNTSNTSEASIDKEIIFFGILAQITDAMACLLNSLTALEFILAQAPRNMQGLLIGIWYAYNSVAKMVQLATAIVINTQYSYLPSVIKLPLAVTSFITYVIVSHWYRYRERNEASDINQQNIIEEYTERQLLRKSKANDISYNTLVNE